MLHRIRESLRNKESIFLKNVVEVDELYYQTKTRDESISAKDSVYDFKNKSMIVGMIERAGELKLEVSPNMARSNLYSIVHKNIDKAASLMTDGESAYSGIGKGYASHQSVNHRSGEYVRGDVHTNTIEGAFGLFRRTIIGTYHKLSPKHLARYCDEMQYRYNSRKLKDGQRFEVTLNRLESRLSWKQLTQDNGLTAETVIEPHIPSVTIGVPGKKTPIRQMQNGKVIATYPSIVDAEIATGIKKQSISRVLRGRRLSAGGFEWEYL
jgi:transposase-like protein